MFTLTHRLLVTVSANSRGHVLGILGLGAISRRLAHKARAVGMYIHYYDVVRAPLDVERDLEATFCATLPELLAVAGCVTLHTPLNIHRGPHLCYFLCTHENWSTSY